MDASRDTARTLQDDQALVAGRYRLLSEIGRGGMGVVYLAVDLENPRRVAVKILEDEKQARIEARLAASLQHRSLPQVYEVTDCFLVMEYIEGRTLDVMCEEEGPQDEAVVLGWARQLCDVLAALHGLEPPVIFRDLKPQNVILTEDGRAVLIDFGIAKLADPRSPYTHTQARGMVSRGYSPPEQYGGTTDAASDLYSLGATMYTMLTGIAPPSSVELAAQQLSRPPVRALRPGVSRSLEALIEALMQLERTKRPTSARQVAQMLADVEQPQDAVTEPAPLAPRPAQAPRTPPRTFRTLGITLAVLLVLVLLFPIVARRLRFGIPPPLGVPMPVLKAVTIQPGEGVGDVRLGARLSTLPPTRESQFGGQRMLVLQGSCIGVIPRGDRIGKLVLAPWYPRYLDNHRLVTAGGVELGAPVSEVQAEFGEPSSRTPVDVHIRWTYAARGISFYVAGGRVRVIEVTDPVAATAAPAGGAAATSASP
ncbi:MAG: serine/threonine-protein kinase [Candidatus Xenobia bacterium]